MRMHPRLESVFKIFLQSPIRCDGGLWCGRRPIILQVTRKNGHFCGRRPNPGDVSRTLPFVRIRA